MRLIITALALGLLLVSGCKRSPSETHTFSKNAVSEADFDRHIKLIKDAKGVRTVTKSHDSTNQAVIVVHVDNRYPEELKQLMRDLGYIRIRD